MPQSRPDIEYPGAQQSATQQPATEQPDGAELARWVEDAADRALQLVADLDDEQMTGRVQPGVNPLVWEIGHLAWFQEKFVLREACGHPPLIEHTDALYDSGAVPHDTRWYLALPSRKETVAYVQDVAATIAAMLRAGTTDVVRHFARYTVHHYDTHAEALTYTRQTLGYPPPELPGLSDGPSPEGHAGALPGEVTVDGGELWLGALRADPFVYDNEKWAHRVVVAPFALDRALVTQEEYAGFVEDGGYADPRLWSDGGAWLRRSGAEHPVYWRRGPDGGWERRHFDRWVPLEPHLPVSHVSWWEADAFARWRGRRLPTEAEWEYAATGGRSDLRGYPWGATFPGPAEAPTDWRSSGPVDVAACPEGDSPVGCRQFIGNLWEWTASDFTAYPNFERDAYADNSEQFFGGRKVLRGGAWATRGRYLRTTIRNYFTPDRRDVLAGFRTASTA